MHLRTAVLAVAASLLALPGCGDDKSKSKPASRVDRADFVRQVDNPYFPLKPGTTYRYRGEKDGKPALDVFSVTNRTKTILGVKTTVVSDRLYLAGKLEEVTSDWYTQDTRGNVWYFGEATKELDASGRVKSREGSWQAGVNGARGGIFMPAHPKVGQTFRQEYYKGHAEDHFKVLSRDAPIKVPYGSSRHALKTKEWTPLEPGVVDAKYYLRGVGTALEASVKGGNERLELVSVTRR
jgi:hypothetical protein